MSVRVIVKLSESVFFVVLRDCKTLRRQIFLHLFFPLLKVFERVGEWGEVA